MSKKIVAMMLGAVAISGCSSLHISMTDVYEVRNIGFLNPRMKITLQSERDGFLHQTRITCNSSTSGMCVVRSETLWDGVRTDELMIGKSVTLGLSPRDIRYCVEASMEKEACLPVDRDGKRWEPNMASRKDFR
jgi:hypothetical protein